MEDKKNKLTTEVINPDEYKAMFGNYTGTDMQQAMTSYPYLIILQNQQQANQFQNNGDLKNSDFGKLYIRSKEFNMPTDLHKTISGTLVKEQFGGEFWGELMDDNNNVINRLIAYKSQYTHPGNQYFSSDEKAELTSRYPKLTNPEQKQEPNNVYKLLIALDEPIVLASGEVFKVVCVTVKGGSFMEWSKEALEQRKSLLANNASLGGLGIKQVANVPTTFWKVSLSTVFVDGTKTTPKSNSYYKFVFSIGMNTFEQTKQYAELFEMAKDIDLIPMRPVNDSNNSMPALGNVNEPSRDIEASVDNDPVPAKDDTEVSVKPLRDEEELPF